MIRIVVASHGAQAKGMVDTVQMLTGPQQELVAYCLQPEQTMESFSEQLKKEVEEVGVDNIIYLTDIMNGSPCNAVSLIAREYNVHHISGINTAGMVCACLYRNMDGMTVEQLSNTIIAEASHAMVDVHALLNAPLDDDDDEE